MIRMNTAIAQVLVILAVLLLPAGASHQETGDGKEYVLEGILHLGGRECPAGQDWPCTAYFELDGEAARQLFDNMQAEPEADLCTEGLMKTDASGLHCYRSGGGEHGCYFGYSFAQSRVVEGDFSC